MSSEQLFRQIHKLTQSIDDYGSDVQQYKNALDKFAEFELRFEELPKDDINYNSEAIRYELDHGTQMATEAIETLQKHKPHHSIVQRLHSMHPLQSIQNGYYKNRKNIIWVLILLCVAVSIAFVILPFTLKPVPRWASNIISLISAALGVFIFTHRDWLMFLL